MYVMADKMKSPDKWAWVEWIVQERGKKEWSQADLARKAEITRQTVNDYESRRRANPDEQILMRISRALGYPPVHLPRIAGIYPAEPEIDESTEQIIHESEDLENQDKQEVLAFIRMIKNLRKRK